MKMNRITLATAFCSMMLSLAAATAGAQITDPGDVGGNVFSPAGNSDDYSQSVVTRTPWRPTMLAFRRAFAALAPELRVGSAGYLRPAHTAPRGTRRSLRSRE